VSEAIDINSSGVQVGDFQRQDFTVDYLLNRLEELAIKVYSLTSENKDLSRQLKEWNSLDNVREMRAQIGAVPVDAIRAMWAMTPYCEMTDEATLDAVKAWLDKVQPWAMS
jgi:hypothetical protein